jgi:hypothetical protein
VAWPVPSSDYSSSTSARIKTNKPVVDAHAEGGTHGSAKQMLTTFWKDKYFNADET